jgi:hypothetical protein
MAARRRWKQIREWWNLKPRIASSPRNCQRHGRIPCLSLQREYEPGLQVSGLQIYGE